jgi:uncharacterized membrane protein
MLDRLRRRAAPRRRLDQPRRSRPVAAHYDPDAFGRVSEGIARYFGTARYLVIQTALVCAWIGVNAVWAARRWDPYPFILLNLAFSTQAAYAAPLILLAQNRQAERDRAQSEADRRMAIEMRAESDFLSRELAGARLALGRIEAALARTPERSDATDASSPRARAHRRGLACVRARSRLAVA